jgi:hypothetical protein
MRSRFVRNPDVCLTQNQRRKYNDSERRHALNSHGDAAYQNQMMALGRQNGIERINVRRSTGFYSNYYDIGD